MEAKPKKKHVEPGPELPTDDMQVGVTYVDFESLEDFPPQQLQNAEQLLKHIEATSRSDDWKL